jgi:hypothetical protein
MQQGTPYDVRPNERGEGLVEVIVAAAVASIAVAAILGAAVAATHRFGAQSVDEALRSVVQRELRVAIDLLKYQGGSIAPATVATSAPLPGGSPLPIHVSISANAIAAGGYTLSITATADGRNESATLTTSVAQPVPLPSAQIVSPSNAAAPI